MVFTSPIFIFAFLPIILGIHFIIKNKYRNYLLLFASLLFYAWGEPKYILIMLLSIIINYCCGIEIDKKQGKKKFILILSIILNLGMLLIFKYGNFCFNNIKVLLQVIGINLNMELPQISLPIGISFFTFQGLSYVIDVYRGDVKVQKSIFNLALYISFFPQLIAGPIVRYIDIEKEIQERKIDEKGVYEGLKRFTIGFMKKMIIANQMGYIADKIFAQSTSELVTVVAWLGAISYSLQIYYDFSAYSDMAIGLGKVFGFNFIENFNYPYISKSIKEFWNRWHISLSSWFKDYLYIPLGGNRKGKARTYINLIIVFGLSGFWHGAAWTFLAWGIYQGIFLVIERVGFGKVLEKLWWPVQHIYAILAIIIGWVLFRADTMTYAYEYIKLLFVYKQSNNINYFSLYLDHKSIIVLLAGLVCSMPIYKICIKKISVRIVDSAIILGFFLAIVVLASTTYNPFIYFRF